MKIFIISVSEKVRRTVKTTLVTAYIANQIKYQILVRS